MSIGVIGAGISGLSAAYALKKKGFEVTVYEKDRKAGGLIQSHQKDGWLVEEGPNTMLVRDQKLWDLLDELQLTGRLEKPGAKAKKRFIVRDGKAVAAPRSITSFLKTDLLSISAKLRLLKEPFMSAPEQQDEAIASFMRRRLGTEPLDYGVNPFVSGVFAGDPERLSVKHTFSSLFEMEQTHGSITKGYFRRGKKINGAGRTLISFDEGMQVLPQQLAKKIGNSLLLNAEVKQISKHSSAWEVHLAGGEAVDAANHQCIISTLPAYQQTKIFNDERTNKYLQKITEIEYAPMSVLALGFKRNQINHPLDGFGMLIPEIEPFSLLGCLFSSSLFEHRAPEGHVLLSCFMGGARHPKLAARSTDSLIAEIMPQLRDLLGVQGEPVFRHHQFWPQAIPQYTVGYDAYLQAMERIETDQPGLFLVGNYRGGISVPDCILNGFMAAERITTH